MANRDFVTIGTIDCSLYSIFRLGLYILVFSIQWLAIYDAAFLAPSELRNKTLMNYIIIWFIGTETGGFIYSGGPFFYALDPHNLCITSELFTSDP